VPRSIPDESGSLKEGNDGSSHAQPGEVVDVRPLGPALATAKAATLLKTEKVEIVRLVMAAGRALAKHKAPGEITVHCLEGRIAFTALGQAQELTAGRLVFLPAGEPCSLFAQDQVDDPTTASEGPSLRQ
jgi:quercetin dioxygenase-like cupin family protein